MLNSVSVGEKFGEPYLYAHIFLPNINKVSLYMYVLCYVYGWLVYVTVSAVKQYTVAGEGGPGPGGDLEIRPALTGDLNIRIISKMGFCSPSLENWKFLIWESPKGYYGLGKKHKKISVFLVVVPIRKGGGLNPLKQ